jgi:hypothetical protein
MNPLMETISDNHPKLSNLDKSIVRIEKCVSGGI